MVVDITMDVEQAKRDYAKQMRLHHVPSSAQLLELMPENQRAELKPLFKTRKVRSISGVSVVAIMPVPAPCPGKCTYCPTGFAPKSYTGFEPAALRARQNEFDAFKQVSSRLEQFKAIGHEPSKCELIVMGGTFNSLPLSYQTEFVKRAFDGFNGTASNSLEEAQLLNEHAVHRVIGLTFETRPDHCSPAQVQQLLEFGATRVEIGVQSLSDEVHEKTKRGNTVQDVVDATRRLKDAFLKVGYHMMPGLYSTKEKDKEHFSRLFSEEEFQPDMLKIYPCLVMPGTELYEEWRAGRFTPYDAKTAADVISECKAFVPPYCRVMRIDRDIPTTLIAAGVEKSNLRQLIAAAMHAKGLKCKCIRCREAGFAQLQGKTIDFNNLELIERKYSASGGIEYFISYEYAPTDSLIAFVRLRIPSDFNTTHTAGIRELRVFGTQVPVGSEGNEQSVQHKHLGRELLAVAEKIAFEKHGAQTLLVTAGVGVREYYARLGYAKAVPYMKKTA